MERRKKANTPLEQIFYNTQDIIQLEEAIAPFYNCSIDLSNDSVSVAVSNTNLPTDITKAYITDYNGNVYKFIAFNDDKTTAYIEYYASLKGADGQDGRDGADDIDDTTTANNKLWSSEKTSTEITNAKDKGIYYTKTQPTNVGANLYSLNFDNEILNINSNIPILKKDLLFYIDANDKVVELYRIEGTNSLTKIGDIGGGNQIYQHNITLFGTASNTLKIQLLSEDNTPFNFTKLKNWLIEKGFETSGADTKYYYKTSGHSTNNTIYDGIAYDNTNITFRLWYGASCITYNFNDSDFIDDTII